MTKNMMDVVIKFVGLERLRKLNKEADEKIGEDIVPQEDILEAALKDKALELYKAGMTEAAETISKLCKCNNTPDERMFNRHCRIIANAILATRDAKTNL